MKIEHAVGIILAGAVVTLAVSARRAAGSGADAPAAAVGYHGAWQLYRNLAVYFGKRALVAEARYWEVVGHG